VNKFKLSGFADEIDASLEVQLKGFNQLGISHMEVRGFGGRNVSEHTAAEVREAKKMMDEHGIKVSSVGSPIGKIKITDPFAPELDKFKHILELTHIFEASNIRMFSFFMPEDGNNDDYRDEVVHRWGQYVDAARGAGVMLLHENEKGIYGDTAARCLDLIKTLDCPYARLVFDPANFVQCDEDTLAAFELLGEYVTYVHIKDSRLSDKEIVPAGQGDGNIEEILGRLAARGYDGFVSLEPHLGSFVGLAALEGDHRSVVSEKKSGLDTFKIAADALREILARV